MKKTLDNDGRRRRMLKMEQEVAIIFFDRH